MDKIQIGNQSYPVIEHGEHYTLYLKDLLPCIQYNNVRIEWVNLKEGVQGTYDPSDPQDMNLLRFDAYQRVDGEWSEEPVSYCTHVPAETPTKNLQSMLITMGITLDFRVNNNFDVACQIVSQLLPYPEVVS